MRIVRILIVVVVLLAVAPVVLFQVAPATATRLALDAERSLSGLERKEITLPGDLRYVYLEGGQGEPLMLLHGFGADKDNFTRVARYLTPHYRVILPDHIGFGESAHPEDADYTSAGQAGRLRALAAALGIERVHLSGSSMGGHIAMAWAAAYPEDVASLWLLDPGGVWSGPESELARTIRETGTNPLMARSADEFRGVFEFAMADPPYIPGPMLEVMAEERMRNFELEGRIFEQISQDPIEDRIRGMKTPSLIVWGREDRAIDVGTAEVLHGLLPQSQVIVMEGIGHLPMIEAPEQSAEDYLGFRAKL